MQEYVHYGNSISEAQKRIMIAQVDGLTVLRMVEKEISKMMSFGGCANSKTCKKCNRFAKCARARVEQKIIER